MAKTGRQRFRLLACATMLFSLLLLPLPVLAQSSEQCLRMVRKMEVSLPSMIEAVKAQLKAMIPDPAAYEKTLPPMDKVSSSKDKVNLRNYGGLSEAFLFSGQKARADELYAFFTRNAKATLGPDETYSAAINGDFAIYHFSHKDYKQAEALFLSSISDFEKNLSPSVYNNLITNYLCMSLIRDKQEKKDEAVSYAKKLIDLSMKSHEKVN